MLGGWLVRLLIAVLIIRLLWSFFHGIFSGATEPRRQKSAGAADKSLPLARDPVCGTFVQQSRALEARSGGQVHYFCSEKCRRTFMESS